MQETARCVSTDRILEYLVWAEANEPDVWLRDDYRIAWITLLRASRGESIPHVTATYAVLGLHPNKVWPAILAHRKALLGTEIWGTSSPPKKPVESVRWPRKMAASA